MNTEGFTEFGSTAQSIAMARALESYRHGADRRETLRSLLDALEVPEPYTNARGDQRARLACFLADMAREGADVRTQLTASLARPSLAAAE